MLIHHLNIINVACTEKEQFNRCICAHKDFDIFHCNLICVISQNVVDSKTEIKSDVFFHFLRQLPNMCPESLLLIGAHVMKNIFSFGFRSNKLCFCQAEKRDKNLNCSEFGPKSIWTVLVVRGGLLHHPH